MTNLVDEIGRTYDDRNDELQQSRKIYVSRSHDYSNIMIITKTRNII